MIEIIGVIPDYARFLIGITIKKTKKASTNGGAKQHNFLEETLSILLKSLEKSMYITSA